MIDNSQEGENPPPSDLPPIELGDQVWENGRLVYFCITKKYWHGFCKEEYNLSGDFPNNISNWSEINTLSIFEGAFSDSLPAEIFNLTNLTILRSYNSWKRLLCLIYYNNLFYLLFPLIIKAFNFINFNYNIHIKKLTIIIIK